MQPGGSEDWLRPENRTYRNVRLAMIAVLLLLTVSVVIERLETSPSCWQGSISAYYYTPAHGVFVCSVLAIGVCMIVLKGNTPLENALLNIGGMFAPVVALVPTPNPGSCWSVSQKLSDDASPNIANNVWALFAAGGLGLVMSYCLMAGAVRADKRDQKASKDPRRIPRWGTVQSVALAVSTVVLFVGIVWFWRWPENFEGIAHYAAAITFFALIIAIVCLNAFGAWRNLDTDKALKMWVTGLYAAIAVLMLLVVGYGVTAWLTDSKYSLLRVEVYLVGLFIVFWIVQTKELWTPGLRRTNTEVSSKAEALAAHE